MGDIHPTGLLRIDDSSLADLACIMNPLNPEQRSTFIKANSKAILKFETTSMKMGQFSGVEYVQGLKRQNIQLADCVQRPTHFKNLFHVKSE